MNTQRNTATDVELESVLLCVRGLGVAANGIELLRGFDLELGRGELVALTGPSGCGKTTLLRSIAHLIDPIEGEVVLEGEPVESLPWPAFRRRVILVGQRPTLLPGTVLENLQRPFSYRSVERSYSEKRARELLERVGLSPQRLSQASDSLSEGQQQRVSLVRALLLEPPVLLLDEPTSALDRDAVERVENLVREEIDRLRHAALIVTHDLDQAQRWCDRVVDLAPFRVDVTEGEDSR